MRETRLLSVAVVGIFLLALSTVAVANWGGSSGASNQGESYSTMENVGSMAAPDPDSYESRGNVEAGNFPTSVHPESSGSESRSDEDVPTIESGGLKLRDGIDTGP